MLNSQLVMIRFLLVLLLHLKILFTEVNITTRGTDNIGVNYYGITQVSTFVTLMPVIVGVGLWNYGNSSY